MENDLDEKCLLTEKQIPTIQPRHLIDKRLARLFQETE
jgi:hypothetical protein